MTVRRLQSAFGRGFTLERLSPFLVFVPPPLLPSPAADSLVPLDFLDYCDKYNRRLTGAVLSVCVCCCNVENEDFDQLFLVCYPVQLMAES